MLTLIIPQFEFMSFMPHIMPFVNLIVKICFLSGSHSTWVCQALNFYPVTLFCLLGSFKILIPNSSSVSCFCYNLAVTSPSNFQLLLSFKEKPSFIPNPQTQALHSFIASLSPPHSGSAVPDNITNNTDIIIRVIHDVPEGRKYVNWKEEDDNSGTGMEPDNDEAMEGSDEDAMKQIMTFPHLFLCEICLRYR
ncbi:hypothetical protein MKW92_049273 [Papaver armeniacum]|nr:hypothetical protein MKW92_049273 [Papaver armeniacum]